MSGSSPSPETVAAPWTIATLANGLRVVVTPLPQSQAATLAMFVGVGSRAERRDTLGLSHYLEHMLLKGTESRPTAGEISTAIEGAGGSLNAFTTKELTAYWNRVPFDRFELALDILVDSLRHSLLAEAEIERERTVIQQEIRRAHDEPGQRTWQLLAITAYGDQPLGWDIAGDLESVAAVQRHHLVDHVATWYQPANMVLSIAGNIDPAHAIDLAAAALADQSNAPVPPAAPAREEMAPDRVCVEQRTIEQCNLAMALRTFPREDPDRYALLLLNDVLGQGMSSRLFLEVRERRGLAYSVGSHLARFAETGHLGVAAGVTGDNLLEATRVILAEIERLTQEPVGAAELDKAREHTIGSFRLSLETAHAHCFRAGESLVLEGRIRTLEEIVAALRAVTPDDLLRVARRIVRPGNLAASVVGPFRDEERLRSLIAV